MMSQINSGEYEDSILNELKLQCQGAGEVELSLFMGLYSELMSKPKKSELVIRPTKMDFK